MPKFAITADWLISQLESELAIFDDDTYPLVTAQKSKFESCKKLLLEDPATLTTKTSQTRTRRARARNLLKDILQGVGSEVFVLCTLTVTVTQLGIVTQRDLIPRLRKWWQNATHPRGLTSVAGELCEEQSIQMLMSSSQKRGISEVPDATERVTLRQSPTVPIQANQDDYHPRSVQVYKQTVPESGSTSATKKLKSGRPNASKTQAEQEMELPAHESSTLSGRVFKLSLDDAGTIIESGQVHGEVWLTEPYGQSKPFITITLSTEMCDYFSAQRQQVM